MVMVFSHSVFFLCQMLKFAWLAIKLFGFKLNENDNVTYSQADEK
jgi:hypothetical protein